MNNLLEKIHSYPFEKLKKLTENVKVNDKLHFINLSIGEPKHQAPEFILNEIKNNFSEFSVYPSTKGLLELRQAIKNWLKRRFELDKSLIDPDKNIIPCCGTREALFSFIQASFDQSSDKKFIAFPNPFYQIYEGATILTGGKCCYLNVDSNGQINLDDLNEYILNKIQILMICSPHNPTGSILSISQLEILVKLSLKYNFLLASDECYADIYFTQKPSSLLEACVNIGNLNFKNCVVFHSLSKRSNLPGMRSGFIAGDENIIKPLLLYRTYFGTALSNPISKASIAAWNDEVHVEKNRDLYRKKFQIFVENLKNVANIKTPDASFYIYLKTSIDSEQWTKQLYETQHVLTLPAKFLARNVKGTNPGKYFTRIALVDNIEKCEIASNRIKDFILNN